ncbi:MAG: ATP citrate lyase citrate-binding domain-containing protein, partial [Candidatus Saccharibacteria bacterium]|nr:ATP citrate lyase citrate-binding domain-containing protein [Candidatus Saccharibacteria bacterium]
GASITIADTVQATGYGKSLGNYGEYSGGPTTAETYLYTKEILNLVLNSTAQRKAIVIAGGVANFTDVKSTFKGIIQALNEVAEQLKTQGVKVFVRRGGPNEKEGLKLMEDFLRSEDLYGSVYGSDIILTEAVSDAIDYVGDNNA